MQTPRQAESTPTGAPAPPPFFRYRFADVDYDESTGVLTVAGVQAEIEPRPRELLSELLSRPNEVVSREELLDALWQSRPTVDNVLANAVTKLRKALGPAGAERLVNVPRVGYRLAGPIERVAVGQHAGSLPTLIAGDRVPGRVAYRLEAPLGNGAAATAVWRARDPKLQETRVFKFAADSERLTALKREYTLYRVLRAELGEREDFARVLGANFTTAPYFIECEDGGTDLLAWADEEARLSSLSIPQRIDIFLQIARSVAAAHGVGVLHKDLKPANVLVADTVDGWLTKLTDFGSSRLLEPGRLAALGVTAMGMTVTQGSGADSPGGTPLYLAPELIAGRSPTTQSDLFALGLILYQIVTGDLRRPMSTGWQREIDDALLAADIASATEGRPEDRLGSVAELVERLETLEARRAGAAEAAEAAQRAESLHADADRRRARRPWVVGALVALSVGLATSLWFYRQASDALRAAQQESARANAINEFLAQDVLQSKDLIRAGSKKPVSMLEVLGNASKHVAQRFKGQPLSEAAVRLALGQTFMRLASNTEAVRQFEAALALAAPRLAPDDPFLITLQLVDGENHFRMNEAEKGYREIDAAIKAAGPEVVRRHPELAFAIARADFWRLRQRGEERDALGPGQRMVELAMSTPTLDAETRIEARLSLAELYLVLDEQPKAEALLAEMIRAPAGISDSAEIAYARASLALVPAHKKQHGLVWVEADLRALCDRLARTLGREALFYGSARGELAAVYSDLGDHRRAEEALREALYAYTSALGPDHQYVYETGSDLAHQWVLLGRHDEALQLVDRVTPWFTAHAGSHYYSPLEWVRAAALIGLDRPADAIKALDAIPGIYLQDARMRWKLNAARAVALVRSGHREEGVPMLALAVEAGDKDGSDTALLRHYRLVLSEATRQMQ